MSRSDVSVDPLCGWISKRICVPGKRETWEKLFAEVAYEYWYPPGMVGSTGTVIDRDVPG
jgi:hypothetical protein